MTLKTLATDAMPYEEAMLNQKPTLIEFYADWCTTCQSTSATLKKLHQQYGEQINFVMLDIDNPKWATQIVDYKASGVPQFTLTTGDQQAVATWVGKLPQSIFTGAFDQVLAAAL